MLSKNKTLKLLRTCFLLKMKIRSSVHRSSIIENFERAKQKYNPLTTVDVQQATITFDELHSRYKEVNRKDRPTN